MKIQKVLETDKPILFVDHRESNVLNHLDKLDIIVKKMQLDVGDFVCSDRVICERKRISDFLQSIIDKRLFTQMDNMISSYEKPLLVLEGNPEDLFSRNIHENAVRGALSSLAIDYNIPILWTSNPKETASLLFWIAKREQCGSGNCVQIRSNKKKSTEKEIQEFLLSGLPGINTKRAKVLLEYFGTPERVFTASEEELKKVNGFGKKTAKKIRDLLEKEYD